MKEIVNQFSSAIRMLDLGMKLKAVKSAFGIFNRGKLGIFGRSNRL